MAIQVDSGTLTAPTTAGGTTVVTTGFRPRMIVFFATRQSAEGYSAASLSVGIGGAALSSDGATRTGFSIAAFSVDGGANSDTGGRMAATPLTLLAGVATLDDDFEVSATSSTGFTFRSPLGADGAWIVHYLAVGGDEITGSASGTVNAPASATTTVVSGLGFQPDVVFLFSTADASGNPPRNRTSACVNFGVAVGTAAADQWSLYYASADASGTMTTANGLFTGEALALFGGGAATTTPLTSATLQSFDPDGFTLAWSSGGASGARIGWVAAGGGQWAAGTDTQKTSTGTDPETGTGFSPLGLLLAGVASTTTDTGETSGGARLTFGAADGTSEGTIATHDVDGAADAQTMMRTVTGKVISHSSADSTTNAEADLSSFDSDGFTLNWTTADATARVFAYVAVAGTGSVKTASVTITGVSSVSAAQTRRIRSSGTVQVAGVSAVAAITARRRISGTIAVTGASAVQMTSGRRRVAGPVQVAGVSALTIGTARRRAAGPVTVSGVSAAAATPRRVRSSTVQVAGTSAVAIPLPGRRVSSGTIAVTGASSATVTPGRRRVSGAVTVAGASAVQMTAAKVGGVVVQVTGVSAVTTSTARTRSSAVQVAGAGSVTAAPTRRRSSGVIQVAGVSAVTAAVSRVKSSGPVVVAVVSATSATPGRVRVSAGVQVAGVSAVLVATARRRSTTVQVAATSSVQVPLPGRRRSSGTIAVAGVSAIAVAPLGGIRTANVQVAGSGVVQVSSVRARTATVRVAGVGAVQVAQTRRLRSAVVALSASSAVAVQTSAVRVVQLRVTGGGVVAVVPSPPVIQFSYLASPVYP